MPPTEPDSISSGGTDRWTYGIAVVLVLLVGAYGLNSWRQAGDAPPEDPRQQVERRAADRMAGVRCIGARASADQKRDIARLLAVDTVAPHGVLPAWLPADDHPASNARSAADTWQALAAGCPNAPAFGTPFGFPSAEIEKTLREDPAFAALSDRQWADLRRLQAAAPTGAPAGR
ncbi:hypothetical protein GN316_15970 [Xylophilus sp. Kf1]|nr:hypothetical protein [Xylophilus sp. Kf1]